MSLRSSELNNYRNYVYVISDAIYRLHGIGPMAKSKATFVVLYSSAVAFGNA